MGVLIGNVIHDPLNKCKIELDFIPNVTVDNSKDDKIEIKKIENTDWLRIPMVEVLAFSEHHERLLGRWNLKLNKILSELDEHHIYKYSDGNVFPPQEKSSNGKENFDWQMFKLLGIVGYIKEQN